MVRRREPTTANCKLNLESWIACFHHVSHVLHRSYHQAKSSPEIPIQNQTETNKQSVILNYLLLGIGITENAIKGLQYELLRR